MKKLALLTAIAAAVGFVAPAAMAANARQPYHRVNHANDKGNSTGDADTARLNQQQLDQARAAK